MPAPLPSWGNGAVRFDAGLDSDGINRDLVSKGRGLVLFMKETWQPAPDLDSELPARRALLERWATADQTFRDSYLERARALGRFIDAPSTLQDRVPLKRFVCVAEVDRNLRSDNYKRLLKILILCYMYRHLTPPPGKLRHAFGDKSRNDPHLPSFLPLPDQTTLDYGLSSMFLENADLRAIETTRTGTVYLSAGSNWYIIDQEALRTGRVRVVEFRCDGAVDTQAFIRPFNIWKFRSSTESSCWPLSELIEHSHLPSSYNAPLDLDVPLPDLLHGLKSESLYRAWGDRVFWQKEIEDVAPGYLELEAQGREVEYDLDRLLKLGS